MVTLGRDSFLTVSFMAFRPKLIPTLFTIPALIVLVALALWQTYRMEWKQDLIDRLTARSAGPAVALENRAYAEIEDEFRLVHLEGEFHHQHEFYLMNRSLNGNPGVNILTPFQPKGQPNWILVNRGWAPLEKRMPATRKTGQIEGQIKLTGLLRFPKGQGWFIPDNDSERNFWFFIDMDKIGQELDKTLPPYYIMSADNNVPGGFPIGSQWRIDLPNNHLQYALTWALLALALLVIYVLYHLRQPPRFSG